MSDVRNCRKCGKIFSYMGGSPYCQTCRQADEEDFKKVKDYLYRNPGANITQVSVELEISVEKIRRFLKEGRLEITSSEGNMLLECENCGKAIKSGRFCDECERSLAAGLKSTADNMRSEMSLSADPSKKAVGMRYLNKDIKKSD